MRRGSLLALLVLIGLGLSPSRASAEGSVVGPTCVMQWPAPLHAPPVLEYRLYLGRTSGGQDMTQPFLVRPIPPATAPPTWTTCDAAGVHLAGQYYIKATARYAQGESPASPETPFVFESVPVAVELLGLTVSPCADRPGTCVVETRSRFSWQHPKHPDGTPANVSRYALFIRLTDAKRPYDLRVPAARIKGDTLSVRVPKAIREQAGTYAAIIMSIDDEERPSYMSNEIRFEVTFLVPPRGHPDQDQAPE
jgi:hypothetical protein